MLTVLIDRTVTNSHAVHCFTFDACMCMYPWADGQMDRSMLHGIWWFFRNNGQRQTFLSFFQHTLKLFVHRQVAIANVSSSIQLLLVLVSFTFFGSIFKAHDFQGGEINFSYVHAMCGCVCYLSCLDAVFFFSYSIYLFYPFSFYLPSLPPLSGLHLSHTIEFSVYSFDRYKNCSSDTHCTPCDCFDIMFLPFYLSYFMNAPL